MTSKSGTAEQSFDPEAYLDALGALNESEIDLGLAALALCAPSHSGISTDRYVHHLKVLGQEVSAHHKSLLEDGGEDSLEVRLAALKHVLADQFHYTGDRDTYEDLQNASLIRVIDRAKGLPVSLCILYIAAARAQDWDIAGLDIPGHFICRLEKGGQRIMFDPFEDCKSLEAQDLRMIVKKALGEQAELSADYYEPASNRDILMRLQNNIKYRQIEIEDYAGALATVKNMQKVDPDEYRLLLDAGVLLARTGEIQPAIDSLVHYIEKAPNSRDRMEAEMLLQHLHDQLN